jgi:hypothetical protein
LFARQGGSKLVARCGDLHDLRRLIPERDAEAAREQHWKNQCPEQRFGLAHELAQTQKGQLNERLPAPRPFTHRAGASP